MATERFGREWGDNTLIGNGDQGASFVDDLAEGYWEHIARTLGFSEACPVVPSLIIQRGSEPMARRYAEAITWRKVFINELENAGRNDLANQLVTAKRRREPGVYDKGWVPVEHARYIEGTESLAGWSLPRLTIAFHGHDEKRMHEAMVIIEQSAIMAKEKYFSIREFLVYFANKIATHAHEKYNQPATDFLRQLLSKGKLHQDNLHEEFEIVYEYMKNMQEESVLWDAYQELSEEDCDELGIACISQYNYIPGETRT